MQNFEELNKDLNKSLKKIESKFKNKDNKSKWLWKRVDDLKLENKSLKEKVESLENQRPVTNENINVDSGEDDS